MLALLLFACAPTDPWTPPAEPGPFAAATTDDEAAAGDLTLPVQIWYPSEHPDDDLATYGGLVPGEAADGGPAACETPRPVVAFSHGNGGVPYQSAFLTERLATRGWLVVAPAHVGNTTWDADTVPRREVAVRRPGDVAAAFDHLVARSATRGDRLEGCVDPAAGYAVVGHSFGGFTALAVAGARLDLEGLDAACPGDWLCGAQDAYRAARPGDDGDLADPRAWAGVALTPVGRVALDAGAADRPLLVLGAALDDLTPWDTEVRPIAEELVVTPRVTGVLDAAGHYTFTDFCESGVFTGCDTELPVGDAHALITALVAGFLDIRRGETRSADHFPPASPFLDLTVVE
jgi:predicted dienelactone hydrolase